MIEAPYPYPDNPMFTLEADEPKGEHGEYIEPLELAERLVTETGVNLFLTGKAGTGKTTFLHKLASATTKRMIVLAPTGVAAINAGGSTIHSFFQLSFAPYIPGKGSVENERRRYSFSKTKKRILRTLDLLVIDEISMVRPDVLDAVDNVLRRHRNSRKPFGGVQLLLIGDLRQLAPVTQENEWELLSQHYASPYFFESHALREAGYVTVELTTVFRQQDATFVDILNHVRDNDATPETLAFLNRRVRPSDEIEAQKGIIRLTTHNYLADKINSRKIEAIDTEPTQYEAVINGDFPQSSYPAEEVLSLKVGAQVMFIKNDPNPAKDYYNGLIGVVSSLSENKVYVTTLEDTPRDIVVTPVEWENVRYSLSEDGDINDEVQGTFTQIPLRLAWAITIHKSQGLTFEKAVIDASRSFAPGQTYVALSRCRTLEGLYLEAPLSQHAIMTDGVVSTFINNRTKTAPDASALEYYTDTYYIKLLHELFDFKVLARTFENLHRIIVTELPALFPKLVSQADAIRDRLEKEIVPVSDKFHLLIDSLAPYIRSTPAAKEKIEAKTKGAIQYFTKFLDQLQTVVKLIPTDLDNKQVKARLSSAIEATDETVTIMTQMLKAFGNETFTTHKYLQERARILLTFDKGNAITTHRTGRNKSVTDIKYADSEKIGTENAVPTVEDIKNHHIYSRLKQWRYNKSKSLGDLPQYRIISNKTIMAISAAMPHNNTELANIKGVGPKTIQEYGAEILKVIWTD
ncbi:MAG: AAA family ATPase [Muribaculaceae bacterium]|nr:AAA family ATPase [Muribaculaceae bacterium]